MGDLYTPAEYQGVTALPESFQLWNPAASGGGLTSDQIIAAVQRDIGQAPIPIYTSPTFAVNRGDITLPAETSPVYAEERRILPRLSMGFASLWNQGLSLPVLAALGAVGGVGFHLLTRR